MSLIVDRKTRAEIRVANGIHRISRCDARRGHQIRRSTAAQCKEDRGYNASPRKPNQTPPMQSVHNIILPAVAPHCHIYGERPRTSDRGKKSPYSGEPIVLSFTTVGILRTLCGQHSNLCGKPTAILGKSSIFRCEQQFLQPERSESGYNPCGLNVAELSLGAIEVLSAERARVRRRATELVASANCSAWPARLLRSHLPPRAHR
jgi:hypothetical protein